MKNEFALQPSTKLPRLEAGETPPLLSSSTLKLNAGKGARPPVSIVSLPLLSPSHEPKIAAPRRRQRRMAATARRAIPPAMSDRALLAVLFFISALQQTLAHSLQTLPDGAFCFFICVARSLFTNRPSNTRRSARWETLCPSSGLAPHH